MKELEEFKKILDKRISSSYELRSHETTGLMEARKQLINFIIRISKRERSRLKKLNHEKNNRLQNS